MQGKKKRDAEASDKLKKAIQDEQDAAELPDESIEAAGGGGDLLSSKDEDVIF